MKIKNRKLYKEELDLWKEITKKDIKLKEYEKEVLVKKEVRTKNIYSRVSRSKELVEVIDVKKTPLNSMQVNKRMRIKLERGMIRPEDTLDLHGHSQKEAKIILISFINKAISNNKRCILVITGKKNTKLGAKGVLRQQLPLWLKEESLLNKVLLDCYASIRDGADGARYVLLRKKEKV